MGVKANFDLGKIHLDIQDFAKKVEAEIILRLQVLGEQCVNHARQLASPYWDRTGNLRSSIGWIVVANGSIVNQSAFESIQGSKGIGTEGSKEGLDFAKELARTHPTGYVLIVVAGMNYAKYVETRGFDVLTSAELLAETELPRMIKQIKGIIRKSRK